MWLQWAMTDDSSLAVNATPAPICCLMLEPCSNICSLYITLKLAVWAWTDEVYDCLIVHCGEMDEWNFCMHTWSDLAMCFEKRSQRPRELFEALIESLRCALQFHSRSNFTDLLKDFHLFCCRELDDQDHLLSTIACLWLFALGPSDVSTFFVPINALKVDGNGEDML